jgi:hypothetical protein
MNSATARSVPVWRRRLRRRRGRKIHRPVGAYTEAFCRQIAEEVGDGQQLDGTKTKAANVVELDDDIDEDIISGRVSAQPRWGIE